MVDTYYPRIPYAVQGKRYDPPHVGLKGHITSLVEDMLDRDGATITQGTVIVDGVLWINEITIKFPVPGAEKTNV